MRSTGRCEAPSPRARAGVFVFSWTDEWHRGGFDIEDWDFGLVDRDRRAQAGAGRGQQGVLGAALPRQRLRGRASRSSSAPTTARRRCRTASTGCSALDYPNYEVIVVNDGSTDRTDEIAREYGFRLISTENRGLASARNAGLEAATGEIVAYIDADAYPDPHWLSHLAVAFMRSSHVGIGGPNIPPAGDGRRRRVRRQRPRRPDPRAALRPRGRAHPRLQHGFPQGDASRRSAASIPSSGSPATTSTSAGSSRTRAGPSASAPAPSSGITAATASAATSSSSTSTARPRRCSSASGRSATTASATSPGAAASTATGATRALGWRRWKIYYGTLGHRPLPVRLPARSPSALATLPLVPEWYLVLIALAGALRARRSSGRRCCSRCRCSSSRPARSSFESVLGAARLTSSTRPDRASTNAQLRAVTALLHMLQPLARLSRPAALRAGALAAALGFPRSPFPGRGRSSIWSEHWQSADQRLSAHRAGAAAGRLRGPPRKRLRPLGPRGPRRHLGVARLRMAVEEHGAGTAARALRSWPRYSRIGLALIALVRSARPLRRALAEAWIASVDPWTARGLASPFRR